MSIDNDPLQALYRHFDALSGVMRKRGIELLDQVAGSVSVPLPTPTPPEDREALRGRITETMSEVIGHTAQEGDYGRFCGNCDEMFPCRSVFAAVAKVMPVVDELRAEIEQLRAYAETTRYHQQKHAGAFRELTATRAERAQIVAALDGYQLVDGDCGQPSGTLVQHVAALREELHDLNAWREGMIQELASGPDRAVSKAARQFRRQRDEARKELFEIAGLINPEAAVAPGSTLPMVATTREELKEAKKSTAWTVELANATHSVAERYRVERNEADMAPKAFAALSAVLKECEEMAADPAIDWTVIGVATRFTTLISAALEAS